MSVIKVTDFAYGRLRAPDLDVMEEFLTHFGMMRAEVLMRLPQSPAPIKRIGHGVMGSPRVKETVQWFRDRLGFICSDDVYVESQDNIIGSFNRCDRGDEYVDHHVFFCVRNERAGLNHLSFEVPDIDAVLKDHQ